MAPEAGRQPMVDSVDERMKQLEERLTQVLGVSVALERRLIGELPSAEAIAVAPPLPEPWIPLTEERIRRYLRVADDTYQILTRVSKEVGA